MYKVTFTAVDAPDVQVVSYFTAEKGQLISTARQMCLDMFGTTDFIKANIVRL